MTDLNWATKVVYELLAGGGGPTLGLVAPQDNTIKQYSPVRNFTKLDQTSWYQSPCHDCGLVKQVRRGKYEFLNQGSRYSWELISLCLDCIGIRYFELLEGLYGDIPNFGYYALKEWNEEVKPWLLAERDKYVKEA